MWWVIVVIVVAVLLAIWLVATYNRLVRQRNAVQASWRQVDVELHRRYDLIPNLVATVQGYAGHERAVFEDVTRLRAAAAAGAGGPAQRAQAESELGAALRQMMLVVENYPQLQASQNFTQLQAQLTETEDRIAAGRRFYNANVKNLNTAVESFPTNILAGMFGFHPAEYFEITDQAVTAAPKVDFGGRGGGAPAVGAPPPAGSAPAEQLSPPAARPAGGPADPPPAG